MEILYLILFILLASWVFNRTLNTKNENKSSITKIDDKNWIVNNEFVSFEEDTPILRLQQEQEDKIHYRAYESERLIHDKEGIWNDLMKTKDAINKFPDLGDCITEEGLKNIDSKYKQYLIMCNKLNETIFLSKEEFLIKERNPAFCVDFTNSIFLQKPKTGYTIYNQKTAKYINGDMNKMIQSEFKEKWY